MFNVRKKNSTAASTHSWLYRMLQMPVVIKKNLRETTKLNAFYCFVALTIWLHLQVAARQSCNYFMDCIVRFEECKKLYGCLCIFLLLLLFYLNFAEKMVHPEIVSMSHSVFMACVRCTVTYKHIRFMCTGHFECNIVHGHANRKCLALT